MILEIEGEVPVVNVTGNRRHVKYFPSNAIGDHRLLKRLISRFQKRHPSLITAVRIGIGRIIDHVIDPVRSPVDHDRDKVVIPRTAILDLPHIRLRPVQAVNALVVPSHADALGVQIVRIRSTVPNLPDLLIRVPNRRHADLNGPDPETHVGPDDCSLFVRLVHRPLEILDLRDAHIVEKQLPLAGRNLKP